MGAVLEKAIAELTKLPEQEQDEMGRWLLEELTSERAWTVRFGSSQDALAKLAGETREALARGQATELDAKKL